MQLNRIRIPRPILTKRDKFFVSSSIDGLLSIPLFIHRCTLVSHLSWYFHVINIVFLSVPAGTSTTIPLKVEHQIKKFESKLSKNGLNHKKHDQKTSHYELDTCRRCDHSSDLPSSLSGLPMVRPLLAVLNLHILTTKLIWNDNISCYVIAK